MSREWVDDLKPGPNRGKPDLRDKRWVMRCDVRHYDSRRPDWSRRCSTEGEPSIGQPPLKQYAEAGWFIAHTHGDVCPKCLAAGSIPVGEALVFK